MQGNIEMDNIGKTLAALANLNGQEALDDLFGQWDWQESGGRGALLPSLQVALAAIECEAPARGKLTDALAKALSRLGPCEAARALSDSSAPYGSEGPALALCEHGFWEEALALSQAVEPGMERLRVWAGSGQRSALEAACASRDLDDAQRERMVLAILGEIRVQLGLAGFSASAECFTASEGKRLLGFASERRSWRAAAALLRSGALPEADALGKICAEGGLECGPLRGALLECKALWALRSGIGDAGELVRALAKGLGPGSPKLSQERLEFIRQAGDLAPWKGKGLAQAQRIQAARALVETALKTGDPEWARAALEDTGLAGGGLSPGLEQLWIPFYDGGCAKAQSYMQNALPQLASEACAGQFVAGFAQLAGRVIARLRKKKEQNAAELLPEAAHYLDCCARLGHAGGTDWLGRGLAEALGQFASWEESWAVDKQTASDLSEQARAREQALRLEGHLPAAPSARRPGI